MAFQHSFSFRAVNAFGTSNIRRYLSFVSTVELLRLC